MQWFNKTLGEQENGAVFAMQNHETRVPRRFFAGFASNGSVIFS